MPNNLPTLNDDAPIISDQPIVSEQSGDEALGSGFGDLASKGMQLSINAAENASKSGLYLAQAATQNLKNSARNLIKLNPTMASNINSQTQDNSQIILQNAFVNKEDRAQLTKDMATSMGQLSDDATDAQVKVNNAQQAVAFLQAYPDFVKSYSNNLISDKPTADSQATSFYQTLQGLAARGIFQPHQLVNFMKPLQSIHDSADKLIQNRDNINTASQYHAATYNPATNDPTDLNGTPYNQNTASMATTAVDDTSYRGLMSKVLQPGYSLSPSDSSALIQLPSDKSQRILDAQQGAAQAYGNITANNSFASVMNDYNNLKDSKGILNDTDKAKYQYYQKYINGLSNGQYLKLMGNTALGANVNQEFQNQLISINNNPSLSNDDKSEWINDAKNKYIDSMAQLGKGMPHQFVQPITPDIISPIQSGFVLGGDAEQAVDAINSLTPQNQSYIKSALKTPIQQAVAYSVGRMGDNVPPAFSQDLINFNQKGVSFANLKEDPNNNDKSTLMKIASNPDVQAILNYTKLQDGGQDIANALPKAIQNYVKGTSQQNNDFTLSNSDDVIDDAISNLKKGYDLVTGKNYIFDNSDLALTPHEYDLLGDYAVNKAKSQYLTRGYSSQQIAGLNFKVVNTPDDWIKVLDSSNREIYRFPYDSNLMDAISRDNNKKIEQNLSKSPESPSSFLNNLE